ARASAALRPGGTIALVWNRHVCSEAGGFFDEVQAIYRHWAPSLVRKGPLPHPKEIRERGDEIERSGFFKGVAVKTYPWSTYYDAARYVKLLGTHSDHLALEPEAREGLLRDIEEMIAERYGGIIRMEYVAVLKLARRT